MRDHESTATHEVKILADDGYALGASLFEPRAAPRGTVVIHGATAVPKAYYRRIAEHLARSGTRVLTYDYRGVGASRPEDLRGFGATMSDWARLDARAAMRFARDELPGHRVAIVGHRFGGQMLGLDDAIGDAAGILLVGAQLGWYGDWPALSRPRLWLVWHALVPALTAMFGYLPGAMGLGEDLPSGVAREWARWCRTPEYLMAYHEGARERFARIERPVLLYSFTDDDFAPPGAVDRLARALSGAPLVRRAIDPSALGRRAIGHFGFFRPALEGSLWEEARSWLEAALEGRAPELRAAGRSRTDDFAIAMSDVMADLEFGRT